MAIEDKIERIVEKEMDRLDKLLTGGYLTQEQYDEEVQELDDWASEQYKEFRVNQYL